MTESIIISDLISSLNDISQKGLDDEKITELVEEIFSDFSNYVRESYEHDYSEFLLKEGAVYKNAALESLLKSKSCALTYFNTEL